MSPGQEGDLLQVGTITRGLSAEEGGYHWSGELRLWDNEVLMGWYAANDGSIRSKGTMYFVLHPRGLNMSGRWTGLGYDDQIMTGWAAMGKTRDESEDTMAQLRQSEGASHVTQLRPLRSCHHRPRPRLAEGLQPRAGHRRAMRERAQLRTGPLDLPVAWRGSRAPRGPGVAAYQPRPGSRQAQFRVADGPCRPLDGRNEPPSQITWRGA